MRALPRDKLDQLYIILDSFMPFVERRQIEYMLLDSPDMHDSFCFLWCVKTLFYFFENHERISKFKKRYFVANCMRDAVTFLYEEGGISTLVANMMLSYGKYSKKRVEIDHEKRTVRSVARFGGRGNADKWRHRTSNAEMKFFHKDLLAIIQDVLFPYYFPKAEVKKLTRLQAYTVS